MNKEQEEEKNSKKATTKTLSKANVICCGVLEQMKLVWMELEDGTKCMPCFNGHSDETMYRVNYCPSCGKYVRGVMVDP